jgi:hypothetical protein
VISLLSDFAKHTQRLNDRQCLAAGRAIGVVEGQAKTLGFRLEARGARWRKKNVLRPLTSLIGVHNSIQWEANWLAA